MPEPLVLVSLLANGALLVAVLWSNWVLVAPRLWAVYNTIIGVLNPRFVLIVYGFALGYLYLWIERVDFRVGAPRKQRSGSRLVPYYDETGKIIKMVRIRRRRTIPGVKPSPHAVDTAPLDASPPVAPQPLEESSPSSWNPWPNGGVVYNVTPAQLLELGNFAVGWVFEQIVGHRGSKAARTADKGKEHRGKCFGALRCTSRRCPNDFLIAPDRRTKTLARQLTQRCVCGHALASVPCSAEYSVSVFCDGARLTHQGIHEHGHYTHRLTFTASGAHLLDFTERDYVPLVPLKAPKQPGHTSTGVLVSQAASATGQMSTIHDQRSQSPPATSTPIPSPTSVVPDLHNADWSDAEQRELEDDWEANDEV
ncbi:hypothetical protein MKEN_00842600 [Mycena kentingensis (nom. inval.)]|nr:hypothetical protein MKEN_00842600 [Mycena kentingensis (nom. inval.)]